MNFSLSQMPDRFVKPRKEGITMVMDKGLTLDQAKQFIENAVPHVDLVKLGFGTAYVTPKLREKIELYQAAGIPVYFGGTLMEESITSAAGALGGTAQSAAALEAAARSLRRPVRQRSTLYSAVPACA